MKEMEGGAESRKAFRGNCPPSISFDWDWCGVHPNDLETMFLQSHTKSLDTPREVYYAL